MTTLIPILLVGALASLVAAAAAGIGAALVSPAAAHASRPTAGRSTWRRTSTLRADGDRGPRSSGSSLLRGRGAGAACDRVGHAPWSNLHEFSLAFAAALLATYLLLPARPSRSPGWRRSSRCSPPASSCSRSSLDDRVDPLVPALQQPLLLTIHVGDRGPRLRGVAGVAFLAAVAEIAQRAPETGSAALPRRRRAAPSAIGPS